MSARPFRRFAGFAVAAALATATLPCRARAQERSPDPAHITTVTGRLLDSAGKPVPDGQVIAMAQQWARFERPLGVGPQGNLPLTFRLSGATRTDRDGRFRVQAKVGPARPGPSALVYAAATGHGLASVELTAGRSSQEITIKLDREYVIRWRLLDTQGQPAAGALVRPIIVSGLGSTLETLTTTDPPPYANPLIPAVTADDRGRFLIRGVGEDRVRIEITHEQFATQRIETQPTPRGDSKETPFWLSGARVVEGRITCGEGGKPAVGARVVAVTGDDVVQTGTDGDGRFALNPFPGDSFYLTVFPADGDPYLPWKQERSFSQSARLEIEIALERGVLVNGRVDESPSERPLPNALVLYRRRDPATLGFRHWAWSHRVLESAVTAADGSFQLAVPAGHGHLFVIGGTHDFVHVETSDGELDFGRPSMIRNYPDAIIPLDLELDGKSPIVKATLHRGVTVRARVVTPDGKPVARFIAISPSYVPSNVELFQATNPEIHCRDGELIVPGCDPNKGTTVYLFDQGHSLGTTVCLTGPEASGPPLTVSLKPCGSALVRLVDSSGRPLAGKRLQILLALSPGTVMAGLASVDKNKTKLEADWLTWENFHRDGRSSDLKTDALGRLTIPGLIPGLSYQIVSFDKLDKEEGMAKVEFRAQPGQTLKLPDFVLD